jgi:transposase
MSEIITVGLDLAKNVFQAHGADAGSVANDTVGWNRRSTGQTYAARSAKV